MNLSSMISPTTGPHIIPGFLRILLRLRRAWAVRRTQAAISGLSEFQLRDIGLAPSDSLPGLDAHHRYWRDTLSPRLDRQF